MKITGSLASFRGYVDAYKHPTILYTDAGNQTVGRIAVVEAGHVAWDPQPEILVADFQQEFPSAILVTDIIVEGA